MKNLKVLLAVLFSISTLACYAQTNTETRELRNFSSIKVANAIEAELVKGDKNSISIVASGIDLDKVETNVSDDALEVKLGRGNFRSSSVKVTITYIDIDEVQAQTSAKVFVKNGLAGNQVYLFSGTNSYIEASVEATNLFIEAATNSKIAVKGSGENLDLKIYTNATVDANNLTVTNAEVLANTAAKAEFKVTESIKGSAATAAKITYSGDPKLVDIKTNTGGDIKKK
ncbi:head GIN domain-containing protein [Belliella marina]|uniref:Head GIN domain-containing protein n=1 Tax=Belliella marina TaxID=1644146 RepID=A0ABW4VRA4_9BACT